MDIDTTITPSWQERAERAEADLARLQAKNDTQYERLAAMGDVARANVNLRADLAVAVEALRACVDNINENGTWGIDALTRVRACQDAGLIP